MNQAIPIPRAILASEGVPVLLRADAPLGLRLRDMALTFEVTRDEEYVHLFMTENGRTLDFGDRSHHYLLLTLARRRLADAAQHHPDWSCGWTYADELTRDPTLMNVHIYRLRKQLEHAGLLDPAQIIERRRSTRQVRIGSSNLEVVVR